MVAGSVELLERHRKGSIGHAFCLFIVVDTELGVEASSGRKEREAAREVRNPISQQAQNILACFPRILAWQDGVIL